MEKIDCSIAMSVFPIVTRQKILSGEDFWINTSFFFFLNDSLFYADKVDSKSCKISKKPLKVKVWALLTPGQKPGERVRRKNALGRRQLPGKPFQVLSKMSSSVQGHLNPRSTSVWHVPLAMPAPPESKVSRMQSFFDVGQWLLSESTCFLNHMARGSAMAVLLQQVFIWLRQVSAEWAQSVPGVRRCFPLEELPFPPTRGTACVEWAVSNRAWDESDFPDVIHHLLPPHSTPRCAFSLASFTNPSRWRKLKMSMV